MTVVPLTDIDALEQAVTSARRSFARHLGHCKARDHGLDCGRCALFAGRVDRARARLDAATSQIPQRHMHTTGALDRRRELQASEFGEAA